MSPPSTRSKTSAPSTRSKTSAPSTRSKTSAQVREHMTAEVVSVGADTPLAAVMRIVTKRDVSCVLVTAPDGSPAGVISLTDLLRAAEKNDGGVQDALRMFPPSLAARDVMQVDLATVAEEASVGEAAATLLARSVHRVFVKRGEAVVGVFSTRDAMKVVVQDRIATPLVEVMSTPVATIGMGASIDEAVAALDASNVRGLVVVDATAPVGLFTQLEAIRARAIPAPLRRHPVEEVMSYETMALEADTPLYRAAGHAMATRVRRILVVDPATPTKPRTLRGIVTGYDLVRVLIDDKAPTA